MVEDNGNDFWGSLQVISGDVRDVAIQRSQPNPFPGTFGSYPQTQAKPGQGVYPAATPTQPGNPFNIAGFSLGSLFTGGAGMTILIILALFFFLRR